MAAPGESGASGGGGSTEEAFMTFYSEVKQIEKRDSVLTSKNQIERLTRPGSSYFNLNPFEVLQIDPEVTDEGIKKRFQQLSILVHPDKNQDDADRAQKAFEAVDKAYKLLLDQEQKKRALDVIQAGKEYVEHTVKERKKQLKKEGIVSGGGAISPAKVSCKGAPLQPSLNHGLCTHLDTWDSVYTQ